MIRTWLIGIFALVANVALQGSAIAQEDQSYPMVDEWILSAKLGSEKEFMDALKAHVAWRRDNKDPWNWNVYALQSGRMDAGILARSAGHKYADIGTYGESEFGRKAARHWNETVAPYAGAPTRYLRFQTHARYWPGESYDYLLILPVDAAPDGSGSLVKAAATLYDIVREAKLGFAGGLEYTWVGGGPAYQYVEGYDDWASTSPGGPLAVEANRLVVEQLGEEKASATYEAAKNRHTSSMKIYKRLDW